LPQPKNLQHPLFQKKREKKKRKKEGRKSLLSRNKKGLEKERKRRVGLS